MEIFFASLVIYSLLFALARGCSLPSNSSLPSLPTVTVKNGTYAGIYSPRYNQDLFLGMRYAQPAARFSLAEPLNSVWTGIRNATEYSAFCIGFGSADNGYPLSEDCLYINVVRPAGISNTAGLPVAVWFTPGGLEYGGSGEERYNCSFIIQNSVELGIPIIVVSFNYRVSAFGFLGSKEAKDTGITNIGYRDQRQALRWINENIAAFGGSPDLVTIWGESAGAESVSAQTLAYNGRDDKLFRGVIAQSGFGGLNYRWPGGYNNTDGPQAAYDALVTNTSCASLVKTSASLSCLRNLPLEDIITYINQTGQGIWAPAKDDDFIANWPAIQLRDGLFPRIPILIGTDTEEGTHFGPIHGIIQTDAEMDTAIAGVIGAQAPVNTGKGLQEIVDEALYLYPDIQAVGIPSLETFSQLLVPNSSLAESLGLEYRRSCAFFGDLYEHSIRRRASIAWSRYGAPCYTYRWDVTVNGEPDSIGAVHFSEVAFVFYNLNGVGYAINPFANESDAFPHLAKIMSDAWINFVVRQDPNSAQGVGLSGNASWPVYNASAGGGVGQNIVWSTKHGNYIEFDSFRAEPINWMLDLSLSVFGN